MEENELIDLSDVCDRIYKTWKKVWKQCIIIVLVCICLFEAKIFLTYQRTYTSSMTVVVSTKGEDILVSKDSNEETNNQKENSKVNEDENSNTSKEDNTNKKEISDENKKEKNKEIIPNENPDVPIKDDNKN